MSESKPSCAKATDGKPGTATRRWKMPKWMKPYAPLICNTGGNDVAELVNGHADPLVNLPLSTIQFGVKSQVIMLLRLKNAGYLNSVLKAARTRKARHAKR